MTYSKYCLYSRFKKLIMTLVVATYYGVPLVFVLTAWYQFVNVLSVSQSEIFLKLRCFT